jgi:gamma-glutamyltranspeptidase / glutathione hydrolase
MALSALPKRWEANSKAAMKFVAQLLAPLALAFASSTFATPASAESPDHGGAVSSADPRATAAGDAILAQGGSAVDAAIAVMLALTVVEPQSSGIGGGGFLLHADGATGMLTTYDGRETAPASATSQRFLDAEGKLLPRESRVLSGLSVGVPGNIALAAKAHGEFGVLPWEALFQPAIALARDGFVMNRRLHESLGQQKGRADKAAAARAIYYGEDGEPLPMGALIKVPELADTLAAIAAAGPEAMYGTQAATMLAAYVADETPQDGRMTATDVTAYTAKERDGVCGYYRVYKVCGMGPPSSGGIAVLQMLGQLERFNLAALGPQSPQFWHLFLESQRIAYADRELYLADSDFVDVPVAGLIEGGYVANRGWLINPARALPKVEAGTPEGAPQRQAGMAIEPENGTTHFSVVDSAGRAVSYTSTIEGAFGSGLFFGGYYLNNELTDFDFEPEKDGALIANRVEGGKRPRSSMAPTIVFDEEGQIVLVIGAAGGPTIPVQVARGIIGVLDFGLTAQDALGLPFIMGFGSGVMIEEGSALQAMEAELAAFGHQNIRRLSPPLKANALRRKQKGWEVAVDPRLRGKLDYE